LRQGRRPGEGGEEDDENGKNWKETAARGKREGHNIADNDIIFPTSLETSAGRAGAGVHHE
jgi:hypothetical protein